MISCKTSSDKNKNKFNKIRDMETSYDHNSLKELELNKDKNIVWQGRSKCNSKTGSIEWI